jgi:hypothetical protein
LNDCANIDVLTADPAEYGQYDYCNTLAAIDQTCLDDCDQGTKDFVGMFFMQCETCLEAGLCECCFVGEGPESCGDFECMPDGGGNRRRRLL